MRFVPLQPESENLEFCMGIVISNVIHLFTVIRDELSRFLNRLYRVASTRKF